MRPRQRTKKQSVQQERTVVIIKPDGVKRGLTGEIIRRIEQRGLKVIALNMIWATKQQMDGHYSRDRDYIINLGENTLRTYTQYEPETDIKAEYGTVDPHKIGLRVRQWLVEFMSSGPVIKMIVEGIHAIDMVRKLVGKTIPAYAEMGTIRGDYSIDSPLLANRHQRALRNIVHASGTPEEAAHEIEHWFAPEEVYDYKRAEEDIMF
ncbi:nucleoside-diphosphate kinase [Candidatus Parcubacteria bacterium]|nr:nucleoside-diphosphate kinase [Candidatus Parcubacteria bacterium]